jgi:hypothetical protein
MTAIAKKQATDAPNLSAAQRKLLASVLARAEETRDVMEDALVSFGRWLLVEVFDDDARAALDDRSDHPVWSELRRRAGGPTLRLSERMLYVALHIAARDKRITSEAWRGLEPGRKALLLPLRDEKAMRAAAQHVTALKLSLRDTEAYVTSLRAEQGAPREVRVTPARFTAQVKRFRARVADKGFEKKVVAALQEGDATETVRELEAVRAWADRMLRKLKPEG